MLFLVISEPRPEAPSSVAGSRKRYWEWIAPLQESGQVRSVYARAGRGAVVLFDDFGYLGFEPQHEAMSAFARDHGLPIASLPTGQGLLLKP